MRKQGRWKRTLAAISAFAAAAAMVPSTAYVALQEANAIATFDIASAAFTSIDSLGFQDFSVEANAVDFIEDGKYEASTYPNTVGVRMPDGISAFEAGGVTYLVTANEGDAREWGDFTNEVKANIEDVNGVAAEKVRVLDPSVTAGLQDGVNYVYGSRSFTIYNADTMQIVYDSGNQFESKTASYLASWFNCSNDDIDIDSRSAKKGVEPETTTVKEIDGRLYAFIGLERIGGVMVYDVTNPSSAAYVNYINTRDFSSEIAGDVAPEGLAFVPAAYSESGSPILLAACEVSGTVAAYTLSGSAVTPGTPYDPSQNDNTPVVPGSGDDKEAAGAVVLYTNDVHCATDGYSYLAAYQAQLEADGYDVVTVDIGDAIQGEVIGSNSEGAAIVDIMNTVGYDLAVPGNHEFDYGLERFLAIAVGDDENAPEAQYEYLSCNFVELSDGSTVFAPYEIVEMNGEQVAFVGISTPETYTKSTPAYFQDENGNFIYSFSEDKFYETIQKTVNEAIAEGADRVIALGHLGIEGTTQGWKSTDVIANTTGIDAFIDAHSHETIAEAEYPNKDGEMVPLTSTGTKFANFGVMTLNEDGTYDTQLVKPSDINVNSSAEAAAAYKAVKDKVDGYNKELAYLNEKLGTSEVELTINDADGVRRIRNGETNMGDFVADAYRVMTGADIALVNGGGIRDSIAAGDVTRKDLMDVNPWNNEMCVIRATGQQILDALEHGARLNPEENGGFLQVSGLTYEIHNYLESPVITDSMEMFQSVDAAKERRVQNVMIGGKAIDPKATYTVAGSFYTLQEQGDGFTMFKGAEVLEHEALPVDSEMLIKYFTEKLGGTVSEEQYGNPLGDGRIIVLTEEKQETPDPTPSEEPTPSPTPGGDNNNGQQGGNDQNGGNKPEQSGNAGGNGTDTSSGKGGSVNTGDPTDMYGLFGIMAVAAAVAGFAVYYIQRQKKNEE
jgi:2',3'-cyclic-nucleotide 2'-phosphodiesterase (5'-nucleotidase family)